MNRTIFLLLLSSMIIFSCNKNGENDSIDGSNNSNISKHIGFYLTDAPATVGIKSVNIDIQSIKYSTGNDTWIDVPMTPKNIDLLELSNGKDTLLSNIEFDAGIKIQQIRFVLGNNNTVTLADNSEVKLSTPSAQQSGLKFNVQAVSDAKSGYKVIIDFDASRSIVRQGNGNYSLKPVIRAYIESNSSKITGTLNPSNVPTKVFTVNLDGDTIATISDTLHNNLYVLHGLFSGTYDIRVQNLTSGHIDTLIKAVSIIGGTDKNLGATDLPTAE